MPDDCAIDAIQSAKDSLKLRLPPIQPLGQTTVLVVDVGGDDSLLQLIADCDFRLLKGGEVHENLRLYRVSEDELILLFEPQSGSAALRFLSGTLRLIETFRHKVAGQFDQYSRGLRSDYLDAGKSLRSELEEFQLPKPHDSNALSIEACDQNEATVYASEHVTSAYRRTLMHHGTVMQVHAMLSTNIRNLEYIRNHTAFEPSRDGDRLLHQRVESLQMQVGQVQADLALTQPTLEAAKCVAELCHSQLLASLSASEARENRMRTEQGNRNEKSNRRFMLLGLWLAIIQVVVGWNSIQPEESRLTILPFLAWVFFPVIAFGFVDWLLAKPLSHSPLNLKFPANIHRSQR